MGIGDELMGTGIARGALARGKRIAFGDGQQILWNVYSELVFRHNPNIAHPGSERDSDIEWIHYYKGHRIYNHPNGSRWEWNESFKATPGQMFFDSEEQEFGRMIGAGFVVIEPNVPRYKSVAPNKQWALKRYNEVARRLIKAGYDVYQFDYGGSHRIPGVRQITTRNFRRAVAILEHAAVYIGPEGGLHHGAAAVGTRAVVIFGGFIPPSITGYDTHINLAAPGPYCGSWQRCPHCAHSLDTITADEVYRAARSLLP